MARTDKITNILTKLGPLWNIFMNTFSFNLARCQQRHWKCFSPHPPRQVVCIRTSTFLCKFLPILWKLFFKIIFCHKLPLKKFAKICHNCLQHERVLKFFLFPYFEYCQIWLNIFMDNHNNKSPCTLSNFTGFWVDSLV